MGVEIVPAKSDALLESFVRLPWRIYRDDPRWVAPLLREEVKRFDRERNPFFDHLEVRLLLALSDGRPVGRISAQVDRLHNELHGERTGFFGFFESEERPEVARALVGAAAEWLAAQGMERIRGPFSFNTNGESGLLVRGFDRPPALMMPYNPPYYGELIEGAGLVKAKDLLAFTVPLEMLYREVLPELEPRLDAIAERARRLGYAARPMNLGDFEAEVRRLGEVYNEAWESNWGFVPLTEREFQAQAQEMKRILVPELAVVVERGSEPVAFGLALPDFNQALKPLRGRLFPLGIFKLLWGARRVDRLRLLILGIKREHRVRGVDALLYLALLRAGRALPRFRALECSWILEDNRRMMGVVKRIRGEVSKVYRVYERPL